MKTLLVANWKMNLARAEAVVLARKLSAFVRESKSRTLAIAPSSVMLGEIEGIIAGSGIKLAGQDCSSHNIGAYTGEVNAQMLGDYGCEYVIVGHSERRKYHGETSEVVSQKADSAYKNNLIPIICIGESEKDREEGFAVESITKQLLASLPRQMVSEQRIIAYEPIWSIGTGKVPTTEQIREVVEVIREIVRNDVTILYGGSISPENSKEILKIPGLGGLLIGGASVVYDQIIKIIENAHKESVIFN
jgi:triosephosphate isomerase